MPDEQHESYRRRDLTLAIVVGVFVIAAIFRVAQTAQTEPGKDTAVTAASTSVESNRKPAKEGEQAPNSSAGAPLTVEVAYAGAIDALPETAKVYVFIRPVGERMPLGVQTYSIRDLPAAVEFSAVTPQTGPVEAVARLSMSGAVALQPGDLEVASKQLEFGQARQTVALVLGGSRAAANTAPATITAGGIAAPTSNGANAVASTTSIPVHVALASDIELPPTTVVFLIARAMDGNPAPLAVKRFSVADLPKDVSLSDADAMLPGRSINSAVNVELVARASINGSVKPLPGDYEGRSAVLKTKDVTAPIVLVIDHAL